MIKPLFHDHFLAVDDIDALVELAVDADAGEGVDLTVLNCGDLDSLDAIGVVEEEERSTGSHLFGHSEISLVGLVVDAGATVDLEVESHGSGVVVLIGGEDIVLVALLSDLCILVGTVE